MKQRTLVLMLLGSSMAVAVVGSPVTRWRPVGPPRPYRTVGRNPRGTPVLSWQDALDYMQRNPKFQKDLMVLLPQGLEPEVREAVWPRVVEDVRGSVEVAQAHHFMGGVCPICSARGADRCDRGNELSHRFQRLAIPRGTRYLALTEGRDGRVTFNRVFLGDAIAYRVSVLDGRGFIDLIARCRNTALGQRTEWESYTAFTPTAPPVAPPAGLAPPAAAPPREATAGYIENRNVAPSSAPALPPMAYIGPGQAQFYPRGYQAGSLSLWFQPSVRVNINQAGAAAVAPTPTTPTTPATAGPTSTPTVVVGPNTFTTPPAGSGSGSTTQAPVSSPTGSGTPVQAAPAGSPTLTFPSQVPAQGTGNQQQGQTQR